MDSFGPSPNHTAPLVRDTVVTAAATSNKNTGQNRRAILQREDSFKLSGKEISRIVESIKANNITDINAIKDMATFKNAKGFNVDNLSDHQVSKLVSAVRHNIAENVAELIYNTKNNEKLLDITAKERAHIDKILVKLRQSHITDLNQAIDFVKSHSHENPGLFSKISNRLINIVHHNENNAQQLKFGQLVKDNYTPAFAADANRFTNPFKSDIYSRQNQPRTAAEAKEFLNQVITSKRGSSSANAQATADLSNLILSSYLRGDRNPLYIAEEMTKGNIKQVSNVDKMFLKEEVLHQNVSYVNDVAAKVATQKAKTIITCRLAGQIGCSATGALSMAALVGTSPLIGLLGAFALTLIASIVGFVVGRAVGETIGKVMTGTDLELMTPEEYEEIKNEIKALEDERKKKNKSNSQVVEETEEELDDDVRSEEDSHPQKNSREIEFKASEILKNIILFKRRE
jgi:hypothetical protein